VGSEQGKAVRLVSRDVVTKSGQVEGEGEGQLGADFTSFLPRGLASEAIALQCLCRSSFADK
jgi:hypothetical protein